MSNYTDSKCPKCKLVIAGIIKQEPRYHLEFYCPNCKQTLARMLYGWNFLDE